MGSPELIEIFNNSKYPDTIVDLIDEDDVVKSCFKLKPEAGKYPPIDTNIEVPPRSCEWAHKNDEVIDDPNMDDAKTLQIELTRNNIEVSELMKQDLREKIASRRGGNEATRTEPTEQNYVTLNLGRMQNELMRYATICVGENHAVKSHMSLSSLGDVKTKMFKKEKGNNSELQAIIKIDVNGSKHYIDEDDFDEITIQHVIDLCNFDVKKIPIEITIQEWD